MDSIIAQPLLNQVVLSTFHDDGKIILGNALSLSLKLDIVLLSHFCTIVFNFPNYNKQQNECNLPQLVKSTYAHKDPPGLGLAGK